MTTRRIASKKAPTCRPLKRRKTGISGMGTGRMELIATEVGLDWSTAMLDRDVSEDLGYTGDIPNCEIIDIIAVCAEHPYIGLPINIDGMCKAINDLSEEMYGEKYEYAPREVGYAFRMGYIEIR